MRYVYPVLFLAALLVLTGCPYKSNDPLDGGSYTEIGWLPGKWKEAKPDGHGDIYDLQKKDNAEGTMLAYEVDSLGKRMATYRTVIFSKLGSSIYANVYEPADEEGASAGYYLYQLRQKSRTEMELWPVNENSDIHNLDALKEYLQKHENDSNIFDVNTVMRFRKL